MAGAASRAAWHTPQRMVRAGGSTKTMRLISMVRVSPAGGDVGVVGADGGAAVGADGDGIGRLAERDAVEAVHGAASWAG